MKTDREWFQDKMADAVADLLWECMKHYSSSKNTGENSPPLPEPLRGLQNHKKKTNTENTAYSRTG
jgi:hypothetical protein